MKKIFSAIISSPLKGRLGGVLFALLATTTSLWAYDFQFGDLYYYITSDTTVEVTYQQDAGSPDNYAGLTTATIPETVTYNDISYSVTSIGFCAFFSCSSLTSITIPNSVTSIEESAFSNCYNLISITIPNSVTSIGNNAFGGCSFLTSITVEKGNSIYDSRENCNAVIETATNTLIAGCPNTIIPNSVTSIGTYAFYGCYIPSISIPDGVTSIGKWAFSDCIGLSSITIPNSVTSIGEGAFWSCDDLKTVICEAIEVPELDDDVFYAMPLSEATLYVPAQSLDDYKAAEQWKEFGTILPIEGESEEEIELHDTEMTVVFTNSEDNDSEIYSQSLTIKVPAAPEIEGFTFLGWQPVATLITDTITIQAIYEANTPTSAEVYTNPANPAQKLLRNGQVYILQDGKTYTVMGAEVK